MARPEVSWESASCKYMLYRPTSMKLATIYTCLCATCGIIITIITISNHGNLTVLL